MASLVAVHTVTTNGLLEVANLRKRGILAAGAQQVAQQITGDTAGTAAVEQGEGFLVVGRSLVIVLVSHAEGEGE